MSSLSAKFCVFLRANFCPGRLSSRFGPVPSVTRTYVGTIKVRFQSRGVFIEWGKDGFAMGLVAGACQADGRADPSTGYRVPTRLCVLPAAGRRLPFSQQLGDVPRSGGSSAGNRGDRRGDFRRFDDRVDDHGFNRLAPRQLIRQALAPRCGVLDRLMHRRQPAAGCRRVGLQILGGSVLGIDDGRETLKSDASG